MTRMSLIMLLFMRSFLAAAQVLVPFVTDEGHFMVHADGRFERLEREPPIRVIAQEGQVVYVDGQGRLKVFLQEGRRLHLLHDTPVDHLQGAGQRVAWSSGDSLYVLREGRAVLAATQVERFEVADSMIVVHDREHQSLEVLWRGQHIPIADVSLGTERPQWRSGSNVVTFLDKSSRKLFLYEAGRVTVLTDSTDVGIVATGGGVVGYWDDRADRFMVHERGKDHVVSELRPVSVKTGEGVLAFVDGIGKLRCWQGGQLHTVSNKPPTDYWVEDSLLLYVTEGNLELFGPHGTMTVESYVPERWLVNGGLLVYLNLDRELYAIELGKRKRVGNEGAIPTFDLFGNAVLYRSPSGPWTIIRKGRSALY